MADWQPIETAPRNGAWLILEGEMRGGDTSSTAIGRFEPDETGFYEWRIFMPSFAGIDGDALPEWNWYAEGRVSHWMPLPKPPSSVPA